MASLSCPQRVVHCWNTVGDLFHGTNARFVLGGGMWMLMIFVPRLWAPPTLFNSALGLGAEGLGEVFGSLSLVGGCRVTLGLDVQKI